MKLSLNSLNWSVKHLYKESDTDLFPKPIEIDIMYKTRGSFLNALQNVDIGNYKWNASRRFIIPKDELSYRVATQLHPIDNMIFSAIIYEYGKLIEEKRLPISEKRIFSYRFSPDQDGTLYTRGSAWIDFWKKCLEECNKCEYIIYTDISDFYNQIYHHNIENQLTQSGFPNEVNKALMRLFESITQKTSRGIPIGPHSSHLIAEMSLIPIDESLMQRGLNYCRYVDDFIIFCSSKENAQIAVSQIAEVLDRQQRLILNKQKTKIYTSKEFIDYCDKKLNDNPLSDSERELVEVIKKYSNGDPYCHINIRDIDDNDLKAFSQDLIEKILDEYVKSESVDYTRIRWIYRRLSQIGIPTAVEFSIKNLLKLMPAISDVYQYLFSASENYEGNWSDIGTQIFGLLNNDLVKSNEFLQIALLSAFTNNQELNNISCLLNLYRSSSSSVRRKIILAAYRCNASAWLKELKEDFPSFDDWTKRAFIIASSKLPEEERRFFLNNIQNGLNSNDILEPILISWAKEQ